MSSGFQKEKEKSQWVYVAHTQGLCQDLDLGFKALVLSFLPGVGKLFLLREQLISVPRRGPRSLCCHTISGRMGVATWQ